MFANGELPRNLALRAASSMFMNGRRPLKLCERFAKPALEHGRVHSSLDRSLPGDEAPTKSDGDGPADKTGGTADWAVGDALGVLTP